MRGSSRILVASAPQGPAFKGFGYVQYIGAAAAAPLQLSAETSVSVGMPPDAGQTLALLRGPFVGWDFWTGSILNARAVGDVYLLRLTATATSPVQGGGVTAQALVNGATVPIDTAHCPLTAPAGQPQFLTFRFELVPKQTFVAGGAGLVMTSSVPLTLLAQKLVVAPPSAG